MKITNLRTAVEHFPFDPPIDGDAMMLRSSDRILVFPEPDAGWGFSFDPTALPRYAA